jgi:hypothetical protein
MIARQSYQFIAKRQLYGGPLGAPMNGVVVPICNFFPGNSSLFGPRQRLTA